MNEALRDSESLGTSPCETLLETRHLSKEFRGFLAVSDVNLTVRRGSIHALIGPNGAGKTTVFNLLTKFLPPTAGTIHFRGADITRLRPPEIARSGIVRSFQVSAVFPRLTVLENVRMALQRPLGTSFHFWRSDRSLKVLHGQVIALLEDFGLVDERDTVAVELPYGKKRALELATTVGLDPELLLLDEPTQGMGHEDVGRVQELIRRVAEKRTVLMVEHNLSVVAELCDTITVLERGRVLTEGTYAEVSKDPRVLEAYIGA